MPVVQGYCTRIIQLNYGLDARISGPMFQYLLGKSLWNKGP